MRAMEATSLWMLPWGTSEKGLEGNRKLKRASIHCIFSSLWDSRQTWACLPDPHFFQPTLRSFYLSLVTFIWGEGDSEGCVCSVTATPTTCFPAELRRIFPKVHLLLPRGGTPQLPTFAPQGQLCVLCSLKSHHSEILTGEGELWEAGLIKEDP